jgi:hypothetical protein
MNPGAGCACYSQGMKTERQRVILYGDSLILAGLRAGLEARPGIEILVLDQPLDTLCEVLRSLCPAALIFDLAAVQPDFPLALLEQPGLRLIGINPETHRVLVWAGSEAAVIDATDLVRVLSEAGGG